MLRQFKMRRTLILLLLKSSTAFIILSFNDDSRLKMFSNWKSDFDDFIEDETSAFFFNEKLLKVTTNTDLSGCESRQFSLGKDLVLSDFAGSMGFQEITDWEYYREDDDRKERQLVQPNPLDPSQPKRTKVSSGSVVRIFRGELVGRIGSTMRSKGLDCRVLVKEFSGKLALDLAQAELAAVSRLQSEIVARIDTKSEIGEWAKIARSRSVNEQKDILNVCSLVREMLNAPFLGILGEVNLAELEDDLDPNDFFRALGVPPPKSGAVWIVYEYAGLNTLRNYCEPAEIRRSNLPLRRGFFGTLLPDPIPLWESRAKYIKFIMKQCLNAVALIHESGITHRSIGSSSFFMSSLGQDKTLASSVYSVNPSFLVMKLGDFGFSSFIETAPLDKELRERARSFGLVIDQALNTEKTNAFCQAEDLHAVGLVFVSLLLTSLAEVGGSGVRIPPSDEDTLQRLMSDIFEKDIFRFRDYVEAEDIWEKVIDMLDRMEGWELLSSLCFARESISKGNFKTARELLRSPFFNTDIPQ
jgi:hypothetical protein